MNCQSPVRMTRKWIQRRCGLTVVGTRVHGKVHFVDVIVSMGSGLGPPNRARDVRIAYVKLVVIFGERLEMRRLDLVCSPLATTGNVITPLRPSIVP